MSCPTLAGRGGTLGVPPRRLDSLFVEGEPGGGGGAPRKAVAVLRPGLFSSVVMTCLSGDLGGGVRSYISLFVFLVGGAPPPPHPPQLVTRHTHTHTRVGLPGGRGPTALRGVWVSARGCSRGGEGG